MKIAILQPYFFPYIGYWHLIKKVDKLIIYDDAQYMKSGWINRNRFLLDGELKYFSLPIKSVSSNRLISETSFILGKEKQISRVKSQLAAAYKKMKFFNEMEIFFDETCAEDGWPDVAVYLSNVLKKSIFLLNINTTVTLSSDIKFDRSLSAQDKVLEMVGALNGTEYVNPVGGQSLYETSAFTSQDIELKFFRSELLNIYNTSSILDAVARSGIAKVSEDLNVY
jgi:hypothetical protein